MTQPLEALALANTIRYGRADLKRAIRKGDIQVADVLRQMPPLVQTMRVLELLSCQYQWGPDRTRRLLQALAVSESRTVGALTGRQRTLIAALLDGDDQAIRDARLGREVERWLLARIQYQRRAA
jgi:hypothetical protein